MKASETIRITEALTPNSDPVTKTVHTQDKKWAVTVKQRAAETQGKPLTVDQEISLVRNRK